MGDFELSLEKHKVSSAIAHTSVSIAIGKEPSDRDMVIMANHLFGPKPSFICRNEGCELQGQRIFLEYEHATIQNCPKCKQAVQFIPAPKRCECGEDRYDRVLEINNTYWVPYCLKCEKKREDLLLKLNETIHKAILADIVIVAKNRRKIYSYPSDDILDACAAELKDRVIEAANHHVLKAEVIKVNRALNKKYRRMAGLHKLTREFEKTMADPLEMYPIFPYTICDTPCDGDDLFVPCPYSSFCPEYGMNEPDEEDE